MPADECSSADSHPAPSVSAPQRCGCGGASWCGGSVLRPLTGDIYYTSSTSSLLLVRTAQNPRPEYRRQTEYRKQTECGQTKS
eukprot:4114994-Pyramimonas_sp.AAC.1